MVQYQRSTSAGIRTTPQRQQLLLNKIRQQLQDGWVRRSESGKPMLHLTGGHTLALVDQNEPCEATFVYSMNSATKSAAGVAANVKRKLSSLLQQMQDNEVEKS